MLGFLIPAYSSRGFCPYLPRFFAIGFLNNFYSAPVEIILLTLVVQTITGLLIYRLLGKAKRLLVSQPIDISLTLALFLVLTAFAWSMFGMANQFPRLFDAKYFILKNGQMIPFIIGSF